MKHSNNIKRLLAMPFYLASVVSFGASAAPEVSVRHLPEINLQSGRLDHRVCFYNGEEYSLGAILVVESVVLECKPENDFESNGRLKWHRVKASNKGGNAN